MEVACGWSAAQMVLIKKRSKEFYGHARDVNRLINNSELRNELRTSGP